MDDTGRSLPLAERIGSSKAGAWFFMNVTAKVDPWLLKRTDGRFSSLPGSPVLLLQHTGARSDAARETPLLDALDGDDYLDMALRLLELLDDRTAAEAAQLMIEYDPQPPFDAGSIESAGDAVMARVVECARHRH